MSGEDEEEYSGEGELGSVEEASPTSENGYVTSSLNSMAQGSAPPSHAMPASMNTFNSLHTLSMPMQPQPINAGAMV